MCGGGRGDGGAAQRAEQQMQLQREQMAQQQTQYEEQLAIQKAQYEEQKAIATAEPPPAPNPTAAAASSPLEDTGATSPSGIRMGVGRKKMRTDIAAATGSGLSIPAT